jgi:hypothetical protein
MRIPDKRCLGGQIPVARPTGADTSKIYYLLQHHLELVIECDELEEGATRLARIARDTMQWGLDNKVEFEVSETEVLLFGRRRKVVQAAKSAVVRIGEQSFAIKQEATKWLGFWLDSKLSFRTHFENRMASAKGALHRVASLSRSNGGLSIDLMRRAIVAAVTSVARYGSEIWWRVSKTA